MNTSSDVLFLLIGAVMILAMHAGFAFLELGTVRAKNQVNALGKILSDFAVSSVAYFFIGYWLAYGKHFFHPASVLSADHGYELVKFFFLLTFAAAIPAIISGGIAERAKFRPQLLATFLLSHLCTRFLRALSGTTTLACKTGSEKPLALCFMILPDRSSCTQWVAGLPCLRCCCWVRVKVVMATMVALPRIRPRPFHFWLWARGF